MTTSKYTTVKNLTIGVEGEFAQRQRHGREGDGISDGEDGVEEETSVPYESLRASEPSGSVCRFVAKDQRRSALNYVKAAVSIVTATREKTALERLYRSCSRRRSTKQSHQTLDTIDCSLVLVQECKPESEDGIEAI